MKNGKIVDDLGNIGWYRDGLLHREDGPAFILVDGGLFWYIQDQKHREDGPAVEWADGGKEWWIFDRQMTEEEFNQWLKKKALNKKLQSTLEPRAHEKKNKI